MGRRGRRFYERGIRFKCQGSGRCCLAREDYGYVYVTLEERRAIARLLGISTLKFTKGYTEKTDGEYHLKGADRDCLFLKDSLCGIYAARPRQCRTWPFWPENMRRDVWEREVEPYCPGVGKGRLYSAEEIDAIVEESAD
jgi:hypothetical protein